MGKYGCGWAASYSVKYDPDDAGSSAVFELYIKVNGIETKAATKVGGWLVWDNPTITGIEIPAGAEVIVGVRAYAIAGAWGAWDDFTLYQAD